mmetsp:Transcript_36226/g.106989  ORF Transcript_36226/g.106989 Transcript_36226/m.106989 type:complete len:265 (+) Transcript_36226:613-1407(+)
MPAAPRPPMPSASSRWLHVGHRHQARHAVRLAHSLHPPVHLGAQAERVARAHRQLRLRLRSEIVHHNSCARLGAQPGERRRAIAGVGVGIAVANLARTPVCRGAAFGWRGRRRLGISVAAARDCAHRRQRRAKVVQPAAAASLVSIAAILVKRIICCAVVRVLQLILGLLSLRLRGVVRVVVLRAVLRGPVAASLVAFGVALTFVRSRRAAVGAFPMLTIGSAGLWVVFDVGSRNKAACAAAVANVQPLVHVGKHLEPLACRQR